ncbi:MAG: hypothetical protein LBH82_02870 [Bacteroidales bacterium]|jgi:hypothetical protein|nr:hypothetical protein [Bacteroidales bacterium]
MKKIVVCFSVLVGLLFVGCKKESSDYAGRYIGTLESQEKTQEDVVLLFEADPSNSDVLLFAGCLLTHEEGGHFSVTEKKAIMEIVNMLYPNAMSVGVLNPSAFFVFEKKELTMQLQYNTVDSDRITIRFIGKKK